MALPEDFNNIFGSTATGGLTPIGDVNYAKGWEFVGSNPPTKNDFSYLQNISDLKAQYLYKAIGGDSGAPPIGIPFFWPLAAMPNTVMDEWSDMIFLKFNGATFSSTDYPKLALVIPSLTLTELRGEFIRIWDDGRGVDSGRGLLSAQSGMTEAHTHAPLGVVVADSNSPGTTCHGIPAYQLNINAKDVSPTTSYGGSETRPRNIAFNFLVRAK